MLCVPVNLAAESRSRPPSNQISQGIHRDLVTSASLARGRGALRLPMTQQIPFRIEIKPFESGRGYLLRLAEQLEYSGPLLIKNLAGIGYSGPSQHSDIRKLANFLRQDPADLSEHFYVCVDQKASSFRVPFLGQQLHRDFFNFGCSKICPKCLIDGRPVPAIWDLNLVTACPEHGCQLVTSCFRCGRSLSWLRPRLYRCSCGADLRNTDEIKADVSEICIASLIERAVGDKKHFLVIDCEFSPVIIDADLPDLLQVIEFVGAKFYRFVNDFSVSYRRKSNLVESREIIRMAHNVLSNWPINFHEKLEQIQYKAKMTVDDNGVYARAFEAFHRHRFPKGNGLTVLKAEFNAFCCRKGNRPLRLIGRRKTDEQEWQVWLTPPQAAAIVGDISPVALHHLAARGILNSKVENDGKRRKGTWIERNSITEWVSDAPNWMSSSNAEAILGMSLDLMKKLSNFGLMESRRGGVLGLMDTRNFRKADVEKIAAAFRVDVPIFEFCENPDWVILRKAGFGAKSSTNNLEKVISAVCEGLLKPVGKLMSGAGVMDYVFNRAALNEFIQTQGGYSRAELLNRSEAAKFLTVSPDLFYALIHNELLSPLLRRGKYAECLFLKQDVSVFAEKYIFSSHLARSQSVGSESLRKKLFLLGVEGMPIKYRYATAILYRRDEIRSHIEL